ncbi:MAG: RNA-binding S4 domain-containing protein [Spirochaetales bacterium]|jgi:ribosomal 50S subunit-recycling heat shock protein|nr:RNA-binding S4 domain-containing protein [Spirochaetales bacterium]MBR6200598.1 RNA-binding S4 domain-containing protein [Spirochaetales bacterium]
MRLDKYLKISLIFKTRSGSEKYFENDGILLNGKTAKQAAAVKIGDIITIKSPDKITEYRILDIQEKNVSKQTAKTLYEIVKEEKVELF